MPTKHSKELSLTEVEEIRQPKLNSVFGIKVRYGMVAQTLKSVLVSRLGGRERMHLESYGSHLVGMDGWVTLLLLAVACSTSRVCA
jgi:hypothetical protein